MTTQERLLDVLKRQKFLQADTQRLHDLLVEQGFRTEEPDGTLTITPSISDLAGPNSVSDDWHGWLTKGEWHKL